MLTARVGSSVMYAKLHKRSLSGWRSLLGLVLIVLTALLPAVVQRSSCMMAPKVMSCCQAAMAIPAPSVGNQAIHSTCSCSKAQWSTPVWIENRQVQPSVTHEVIVPAFSMLASLLSFPQPAVAFSRIRTSAYSNGVPIHLRTLSIRC